MSEMEQVGKVLLDVKRHEGKIYCLHIIAPRTHGPDVCIDLTPEQAESLAKVLLIKLGKMGQSALSRKP